MVRTKLITVMLATALVAGCHSTSAAAPAWKTGSPPPAATTTGTRPAPSGTGGPDCLTRTENGLDLEHRVGQLLMIGTPVEDPAGIARTVEAHHLGGVFLAGRSTRSAAALRADIAALQRSAGTLPLLIALDQEGGAVQTLKGPDFPLIPSAVTQGTWSAATLRTRTADAARRLAAIGVHQNLAPVADTVPSSIGRGNPPIGAFRRQFGSTPGAVARDIRTVVPAWQDAGVLATLKHFPGLGRVRANTDTSTAAVDTTTTVDDPYLGPFAAGIKAGTAAVMVSSARYPELDADNVAAFSAPIITGLLREKLGFRGMVVSDDLGAAVAVEAVPTGERAVRFVRAGGDLVLSVRPEDAAPMAAALLAAARDDPAFARRVGDAAGHVLRAKQRAGLLRC
jgi:beta-N-acetylhexosaminidase